MAELARTFAARHVPLGELPLRSLQDTDRLAAALHRHLPPRCSVGLVGTLGAGKTRLVQAFAEQIGLDPAAVTSPTFTMLQQYHAARPLYHLDAYRIADEDELWEVGVEELFEENGVTMIEWADRFADAMPAEMLWIRIRLKDDGKREVQLSGLPEIWADVVRAIVESFAEDARM